LFETILSEELLARRVGDVRHELGLDRESLPPAPRDRAAFVWWMLASVATYAGVWMVALAPLALMGLLVMLLANNNCLAFWSF